MPEESVKEGPETILTSDNTNSLNSEQVKKDVLEKITDEFKETYSRYVDPIKKTGDLKKVDIDLKPRIAILPKLFLTLNTFGINRELAEKMFASWYTFDPLEVIWNSEARDYTYIKKEHIDTAIELKSEMIKIKLNPIIEYVKLYGQEELLSLIDIFGIYNFNRYNIHNLHSQLTNWLKGDVPFPNIVVSPHADWANNIDTHNIALHFANLTDEEGRICYFEVNDTKELAKVAKKIGQHEKENRRDPNVKYVIINAHGSPDQIVFGVNGENLTVDQYTDLKEKRKKVNFRINDYKKYLGENWKLILVACSTGGKNFNRPNIREVMEEGHGVQVYAPTGDVIIDFFKIDTEGNVILMNSEGERLKTTG